MQKAHTIVEVHPTITGVPTYLRKALKQEGPKVRIGCAYSPAIKIEPSVHVFPPKRRKAWTAIKVFACALALYALYNISLAMQ